MLYTPSPRRFIRPYEKPSFQHTQRWGLDRDDWAASGLVGCWPMNEGGGNKVFDLSGNSNTGTLVGNTSWAAGKFGPCLSLDGTGDYVTAPLSITNRNVTIAAWVKSSVVDGGGIISAAQAASYRALYWGIAVGASYYARLYIGNGTAYENTYWNTGTNTDWRHMVLALSDTQAILYENGVAYAPYTLTSNPATFTISIGGYDYKILNGSIDDVMIFNRVLTASEIAALFADPFRKLYHPRTMIMVAGAAAGGDVTVLPSAIALTSSVLTPTPQVINHPAAQALTVSLPAPMPTLTVLPDTQALTAAVTTTTCRIDDTVTPEALAITASIPAPTPVVTQLPSAEAITGSVLAPVPMVTVTPAALALTASLIAPVVDVAGSVTVQPSALALTATVLSPSVTLSPVVSPDALALTSSVLAPVPCVTVLPAVQAITASIPAFSVAYDATVTPDAQAITAALLAPSVSTGAIAIAAAFFMLNRR